MSPVALIRVVLLAMDAVAGAVLLALAIWVPLTLAREDEPRGATRAAWALAPLAVGWWGVVLLTPRVLPPYVPVREALGTVAAAGALVFLVRYGTRAIQDRRPDAHRFDERDVVFTRALYRPGTPIYDEYYRSHPDKKASDDEARQLPPLLSPGTATYDPHLSRLAHVTFEFIEALRALVDGPVAPEQVAVNPERMTGELKRLALHYGALSAGVAALRPAHVYSHRGRPLDRWGERIEPGNLFGLAFTVEMDYGMVRAAPMSPAPVETARGYLKAAEIAVLLAWYIRGLGYPARAHIDGSYEVIAPLVAAEAGLGEIGRSGLLITPERGPRVRIGVVTTAMPLVASACRRPFGAADFCRTCIKCARNCPSGSIPRRAGPPPREDGEGHSYRRWRVNHDSCFRHWRAIGSDCGLCLAVCPYSKPGGAFHGLVRWLVRRNPVSRRFCLWADDFVYGRRPRKGVFPRWLNRKT